MSDFDPNGMDQHAPGSKLDGGKPLAWLCISGFAQAIQQVANVTTYGANKYTPRGWEAVPNGIDRYSEAMARHLLAECTEGELDGESGLLHAAHAAWNALARLELMCRERRT